MTGTVTFAGPPPAAKSIPVPTAFVGCGKAASLDRLLIGKAGGVANAVLYIQGPKKAGTPPPASSFVANQGSCRYAPHVLVVDQGDAFTVANSDSMFHNVHGYFDATHASVFNIAEPDKGMKTVQHVKQPGMYMLRCDVHPWMNAYVYVSGNGYATATDAAGKYTLTDVPPGTYKLVMWHEGWKYKMTGPIPQFAEAVQQTQEITVVAGKATAANFTLK